MVVNISRLICLISVRGSKINVIYAYPLRILVENLLLLRKENYFVNDRKRLIKISDLLFKRCFIIPTLLSIEMGRTGDSKCLFFFAYYRRNTILFVVSHVRVRAKYIKHTFLMMKLINKF